jgi:Transglutaminase-like superfamily
VRVAHPVTALQGITIETPDGRAGSFQTVALMRAMVRESREQPAIIAKAQSIVGLQPPHDFQSEAKTLFEFVRSRVRYVRDVHEVETLTAPIFVLDRMCGDCDDKATLLASLYEAIGFPTRFVLAGYNGKNFEHVYLQVLVRDAWVNADPTMPMPFGWEAPGAVVYWVEKV